MLSRYALGILVSVSCLLTAGLAVAQSGPRLWVTSYASGGSCGSFARAYGPENTTRTLQGHKWPHTPGGGIDFIDHTIAHLNAAAIGRANTTALKNRLLSAARNRAYTSLDFEGAGGSSPAFVSAILVKTLAYATSYLRQKAALSQSELGEIDAWVRMLRSNAGKRASSRDHKMARVVADLMWAAASGDDKGFKSASGRFLRAAKGFRNDGSFAPDIRNNNEVLHQVVGGAVVMHLNGVNALGVKSGSLTLADAIGLHAARVANVGTAKLKTSGDATDAARSIMRAQGWGTHLAWIPAFLSIAPQGDARNAVLALQRNLRRTDPKPYYGIQMGVHTGCLYGR